MLEPAPYLNDIAHGPNAAAYWLRAADGTRIRMGIWQAQGAARGTVLMFPGRTEYIEKYSQLARDVTGAGFAMLAMDWRGQGLADRPAHRRDMGHVESFAEYRQDVAAMRAAMGQFDLPKPHFLIAHSMGGAIGLRALYDDLPVRAAIFSAPMWGIRMTGFLKAISGPVIRLSKPLGMEKCFAPTTGPAAPMVFEGNPLTSDREMFDIMEGQVATHPDLALGGPSIRWVHEAIKETDELVSLPALPIPALTLLGGRESIVDPAAVHRRMGNWPMGRLEMFETGLHELYMECPALRRRAVDMTLEWFQSHLAAEAHIA